MSERKLSVEEKYRLYEDAVQDPLHEIEVINQTYKRHNKKNALSLREDFAGTGFLAYEWVKQSAKHTSVGIDLDPVPMKYGKEVHEKKLNIDQKKRVKLLKANVLQKRADRFDVVVAFNFSYFILKKRSDLLTYFKSVKRGLKSKGIFMLDIFGGTETRQLLVEDREHEGFTYYWDCDKYNAITEDVHYAIHFKTRNPPVMHRNVFTYDWRLWSVAEICDLLIEAGFKKTEVLWEGDSEDGGGNGIFTPSANEENCESFVAYIVAKS